MTAGFGIALKALLDQPYRPNTEEHFTLLQQAQGLAYGLEVQDWQQALKLISSAKHDWRANLAAVLIFCPYEHAVVALRLLLLDPCLLVNSAACIALDHCVFMAGVQLQGEDDLRQRLKDLEASFKENQQDLAVHAARNLLCRWSD